MKPLRDLSARPELVVGPASNPLVDSGTPQEQIGIPGPVGRERCVYALPTGGVGAQQFAADTALRDQASTQVVDPAGNVVGEPTAVWIPRLLTARWTEDSRRL